MKNIPLIAATCGLIAVSGPASALDLAALLDPKTFMNALEQAGHDEMSPLGMFMAADWVVKTVMLLLLFASASVWVIFLAKIMILRWERGVLRRRYRQVDKLGTLSAAQERFAKKRGVVSRMVQAALRERASSGEGVQMKAGIKERAGSEIARIEAGAARRMSLGAGVLANVGSTAPFVGLFGTVWGIMNSFFQIGMQQNSSLAVVAPGIAEALFATAIGLFAAIPAVIAYNRLSNTVNGFEARLQRFADRVHAQVSREMEG